MSLVLVAGAAALAALAWPTRRPVPQIQEPERNPGSSYPGVSRSWLQALVARRRSQGDGAWVADLGEVVSVGLRAGLDLAGALQVAARSPAVELAAPWLAARCADESVLVLPAECLVPPSGVAPRVAADLSVLARAWRLSETTGAAASHTTGAAAASIRSRLAAARRLESALAGPRASMRLLTALPLCGPVVGLLIGVDPAALYGTATALAAGLTGVLLTAGGWWWSATLVRRAGRPSTTAGPP